MKDISRELHDNVGQMLTLAKIQLNNLAEESPDNKRINNSKEFVQTALTDIRALSKTLNNENVLAEGLSKAIKFDLERLERTGIFKTNLMDTYNGQMLDHKKEIVVFRTYQELMQNTMKHAQAKNITVNLVETKECFNLELIDDGIGFDFSEEIAKKGFSGGAGLGNLVHRAKLLGGKLEWIQSNTGGTIAKLTIPKEKIDP
jgi:signal transduction histidine kinase